MWTCHAGREPAHRQGGRSPLLADESLMRGHWIASGATSAILRSDEIILDEETVVDG